MKQLRRAMALSLLLIIAACTGGGGDTTKPTVSLIPSATSFTAAGTLTLTATATDDVAVTKVEFYDGSTKLGEDTTATDGFTQTVSLTAADNGSKSYTAKAFDAAGNNQTSSAVAVTVNIVSATGCPAPAVFDNPACTFDDPGTKFGP